MTKEAKPRKKRKNAPQLTASLQAAKLLHGRRIELTENIITQMADIVRAGNFRYIAAGAVGSSIEQLRNWIRSGNTQIRQLEKGKRQKLGLEGLLVKALEAAEAECHVILLQDVRDSEDVRAKMWFLERRWNKLYSRNLNATIDDATAKEQKIDVRAVLLEKLQDIVK